MSTTISIIIRFINLGGDNSGKHSWSSYRKSKFSNFFNIKISPNQKHQSYRIFKFWIRYIKFDIPMLIVYRYYNIY